MRFPVHRLLNVIPIERVKEIRINKMKKNVKDYDIFDDVPPFDVTKHLPHYATVGKEQIFKTISIYGGAATTLQNGHNINDNVIYNTTIKKVQYHDQFSIYETDPDSQKAYELCSAHYIPYKAKISSAKSAIAAAQAVKQGAFSYLWKESSTQTQIDVQEQDIQVITEVNEQSTQTKNKMVDVAVQTDYKEKRNKEKEFGETNRKELKLTKFVTQVYNKFADSEEVEEFYNEFLSIMEESQSSHEHQELNILGDNSSNEF